MEIKIECNPQIPVAPGFISLSSEIMQQSGAIEGQLLQLDSDGKTLLLRITGPRSPDQTTAWVSQSDQDILAAGPLEAKIPEITLGCDPEFFILWGQKQISAATYLPFIGQIGCDGSLGELRPSYGLHESQVVASLSQLIERLPKTLRKSVWAVGMPETGDNFSYEAHSYRDSVAAGFHVHLGIPPEILNTRKEFNRAALNHLVRCLDWYISVPLILVEENHSRRIGKSRYGQPGDYRYSNITLEYRTPGGINLRSPSLAQGLLGLALLVTENVVARIKEASQDFVNLNKLSDKDLYQIMPIPPAPKALETLTSPNTYLASKMLDSIREELQALPTFEKHKEALQGIFRVVEEHQRPGPNIIHNWKERL